MTLVMQDIVYDFIYITCNTQYARVFNKLLALSLGAMQIMLFQGGAANHT
jgi:hypothetical protein